MEAKLPFSESFCPTRAIFTFPSHSHSFSSKPRVNFKSCEHFRGRTERWRFHVQEKLKIKSQHGSNPFLVHEVKRGEALTSISKQYGVSTGAVAAANKDIQDVNLVLEGQLLYIPPSATNSTQVVTRSRLSGVALKESTKNVRILDSLSEQKVLFWSAAHSLPHVKKTGYFLVLVPLIALCSKCVIDALRARVNGDQDHSSTFYGSKCHRSLKSMRWKSALGDINELNTLDSGSIPDSKGPFEDEVQSLLKDVSESDAYSKLESDYQKFLAECGISKSGYWRGGCAK